MKSNECTSCEEKGFFECDPRSAEKSLLNEWPKAEQSEVRFVDLPTCADFLHTFHVASKLDSVMP